MVNFTTNSTCPLVKGVQQCTAVLSWGGHIGSRQDWGFTNGVPNSAGGISGSPYHMRLISWNLSNLGNQDRSLSAATVIAPGTITIIKNTIPDDQQDFNYTTTGSGLSSFSLADNGTGPNSTTFGGLAGGTYTVIEGAVAGFNLTSLSCADPSGDTTINLGTRTASINLSAGETVICTFENTKNATLTVVKDAIPNDDQLFSFAGSAGIGSFTLKDNGTSTNSTTFSLEPGIHSVSEPALGGWILTNIAIVDPSGGSSSIGNTANIDLAAGENVRVTFTNTKNATIIVNKTAIGGDDTFNFATTGDNGFPQSFSLTTSGGNASKTFNNILPDQTYSVSEPVPPAGWVLTNSSCTKGTPAGFSPAPGETVTCTFENTKNATLTIVKDAIPDDERVFNFTGSAGIGSFKLKDNGTLPNSTTFVLLPGIYNVSETVPAGWNLTSATCSDGSAVDSIGLSPGESVTCTFTNAKLHLSFIKEGALDFAGQTTDYMINVTNDGFANLTIVNMTDTTGILICDTKFPRLLAVGDTISCSVLFATDSDINATTIIEILAQPANIFWRV